MSPCVHASTSVRMHHAAACIALQPSAVCWGAPGLKAQPNAPAHCCGLQDTQAAVHARFLTHWTHLRLSGQSSVLLLACAAGCCVPSCCLLSPCNGSRTWESNFSREGRLWMSSSCAGGAGGSDRLAAGGREAMLLLVLVLQSTPSPSPLLLLLFEEGQVGPNRAGRGPGRART
jgi:hypothetical protein